MEIFIESLLKILKILASGSAEQLRYLKSIGGASIDELALEFEELVLLAPSKFEVGDITQTQFSSIKLLNQKLDEFSGDDKASYWTESALIEKSEWEEVRKLAGECLVKFD